MRFIYEVDRQITKLQKISQRYYSEYKYLIDREQKYSQTVKNYYEFLKERIKLDFLSDEHTKNEEMNLYTFYKDMQILEMSIYEYVQQQLDQWSTEKTNLLQSKINEINNTIKKEVTKVLPNSDQIDTIEQNYVVTEEDKQRVLMPDEEWKLYVSDDVYIGQVKLPLGVQEFTMVNVNKNKKTPTAQSKNQYTRQYNNQDTQFVIRQIFPSDKIFANPNYESLEQLLQQFEVNPYITIYSSHLHKLLNGNMTINKTMSTQVLYSINYESLKETPGQVILNMSFIQTNMGKYFGSAFHNEQVYYKTTNKEEYTKYQYLSDVIKSKIDEKINDKSTSSNTYQYTGNNITFSVNIMESLRDIENRFQNVLDFIKNLKKQYNEDSEDFLDFQSQKKDVIQKYENKLQEIRNIKNEFKENDKEFEINIKPNFFSQGYNNFINESQKDNISKVSQHSYFGRSNKNVNITYTQSDTQEQTKIKDFINTLNDYTQQLKEYGLQQSIKTHNTLTDLIGNHEYIIDSYQMSNIDQNPEQMEVQINLVESKNDMTEDLIVDEYSVLFHELMQKVEDETNELDKNLDEIFQIRTFDNKTAELKLEYNYFTFSSPLQSGDLDKLFSNRNVSVDVYLDNLSRIEDLHKRLQNPTNVKINNLFIKKVNRNNNINTSYIIDIAEKFKIENIFVNIELLDSNTDLLTKVYPQNNYPKNIQLHPFEWPKKDMTLFKTNQSMPYLIYTGFDNEPYAPEDKWLFNTYKNINEIYFRFIRRKEDEFYQKLSDYMIEALDDLEDSKKLEILSYTNEIDGKNLNLFNSTKYLIDRTLEQLNLLGQYSFQLTETKNKLSDNKNLQYHLIMTNDNLDEYVNIQFPKQNRNKSQIKNIKDNYKNTLSKYIKNNYLKDNLSDQYINKIIQEKMYTNIYNDVYGKIDYLLKNGFDPNFILSQGDDYSTTDYGIIFTSFSDGKGAFNADLDIEVFANNVKSLMLSYPASIYYQHFMNQYYLNTVFNTNFNILTEKNSNKLSLFQLNHQIKSLLETSTDDKTKNQIYSIYYNSLRMLYFKNKQMFEDMIKEINPLSYSEIIDTVSQVSTSNNAINKLLVDSQDIKILIELIEQFPSDDFILTSDKDTQNIKRFYEDMNNYNINYQNSIDFQNTQRKNIEYLLQNVRQFDLIKPQIEYVNSNSMNIYYTNEAIDFFENKSTQNNLDRFDFKPTEFYPIYNRKIDKLLDLQGTVINALKGINFHDYDETKQIYDVIKQQLVDYSKTNNIKTNQPDEKDVNSFEQDFSELISILDYQKDQQDYISTLHIGGSTEVNKTGITDNTILELEKSIKNIDDDIFDSNNQKGFEEMKTDFKSYLEEIGKYKNDDEIVKQQDLIIEIINDIISEVEMAKELKTDIRHMQPRSAIVFLNRQNYKNSLLNQNFEILQKLYYTGTISFSVHKNRESPMHSADINISNYSSHILTPEQQQTQMQKTEYFNTYQNEFIKDVIIQSGSELQIVQGYGNNIFELPIVFQGVQVNVSQQEYVNIKADSYGRDLLIPKTENDYTQKSKLYVNPADMVRKQIHDSGSYYFGQINQEKQVLNKNTTYGDSLFQEDLLFPDEYRYLSSNIYFPNKRYYIEGNRFATIKRFVRSTLITVGDIVNNPYIPESGFTPWDIIKDAQYRQEQFIAYPIEYGYGKQRMFFGKRNWSCFNDQTSLDTVGNERKLQYYNQVQSLYKYSSRVLENQQTLNNVNIKKSMPFSKKYYVNSEINLLMNDLQTNDENTYNSVQVIGPKGKINNNGLLGFITGMFSWINDFDDENITTFNGEKQRIITQYYDEEIPDHEIRMLQYWDPNGYVDDVKKIIQTNKLSETISNYYDGYINISGQPEIKPYDKLIIDDGFRNMHGEVEVKEVTHHFSPTRGFETVIKPQMITETLLPDKIHDGKILLQNIFRTAISVTALAGAFAQQSFTFGATLAGAQSYVAKTIYDSATQDTIYQTSSKKQNQTQQIGKFEIYNSAILKPISIQGNNMIPQFQRYDQTNKITSQDIKNIKQKRRNKYMQLGLNELYEDISKNKFLKFLQEDFGIGYDPVYNDIVEQQNSEFINNK